MTLASVVFLDAETLGDDIDLSQIESVASDLTIYKQTPPELIIERAQAANILVTNKAPLTVEIIAQLPQLKLICITATGTDNVDLAAAAARNISVKNVPAYSTFSVAQHVMALLFALATNIARYRDWTSAGNWQQHHSFTYLAYPVIELAGKTLGLIGYGAIAKQVACIAGAVGMEVLVAERPDAKQVREGRLPFLRVIEEADVISLHCPLTADTAAMIDVDVISRMKDSAILINTSRGGVIDEYALADALNAGKFFGVGLDVLSGEPPAVDNPLLHVNHPNFMITPHTAWSSDQAKNRLVQQVAINIQDFCTAGL